MGHIVVFPSVHCLEHFAAIKRYGSCSSFCAHSLDFLFSLLGHNKQIFKVDFILRAEVWLPRGIQNQGDYFHWIVVNMLQNCARDAGGAR